MQIKLKVPQHESFIYFLLAIKQICIISTDAKQVMITFSYGCSNWQHCSRFMLAVCCLIIRWITFAETCFIFIRHNGICFCHLIFSWISSQEIRFYLIYSNSDIWPVFSVPLALFRFLRCQATDVHSRLLCAETAILLRHWFLMIFPLLSRCWLLSINAIHNIWS